MPKGVRKSITIPGVLAATVKQRCRGIWACHFHSLRCGAGLL